MCNAEDTDCLGTGKTGGYNGTRTVDFACAGAWRGCTSAAPPERSRSVEFDLGVVGEALLASDAGLAGGLEFGGLADFVEHVVIVDSGIDAEIALVVGLEQANRGV